MLLPCKQSQQVFERQLRKMVSKEKQYYNLGPAVTDSFIKWLKAFNQSPTALKKSFNLGIWTW